MIKARYAVHFLLGLLIGTTISTAAHAQNIGAGMHVGYASLNDTTILGSESGPEYGVWLNLWPAERFAVSADWSYIYRDDFQQQAGEFTYGEVQRNRQHVDLTLQWYFLKRGRWSCFGEAGGGFLWNNRHADNPHGLPEFIPSGKQSTRKGVLTLGGGIRRDLFAHLHWVSEVKFHNPGSSDDRTIRFLTGLTISLK